MNSLASLLGKTDSVFLSMASRMEELVEEIDNPQELVDTCRRMVSSLSDSYAIAGNLRNIAASINISKHKQEIT